MKKIIIIALVLISTQAIAQKYELTYQSYHKDVVEQDTSITKVFVNSTKLSITEEINLEGKQLIQGFPTETLYINYQDSTYSRQLTYNQQETYLATTKFQQHNLKIQDKKEKILGYNCTKYTTSINSNTIEIWVTEDLEISATPIPQFAELKGVMVRYQRNGSSITELKTIKKTKKKQVHNYTPIENSIQVDFRKMDNIEKEKKIITTNIFTNQRIHWGDTSKHQTTMPLDTTLHFAGGTVILKKLNLQTLSDHYQIFAELTTKSSGDAYDRTGSIFLIPQDKEKNFYQALSQGIETMPYFTSKKNSKYQAMTLTQDFTPIVELIRFFTPFGVGHFNDRVKIDGLTWQDEVFYKQEITDLKPLLQGEVIIGAFIGNYDGGGHIVTLDLKAYPGHYISEPSEDKNYIQPLFNTCNVMEMAGQNYPHFFDTDTLIVEFELPEGVNNLRLRYITTGHGGWGGGDEFNPKPNHIIIDDTIKYQYTPWREDCGRYREWNPVSGNFWNGVSSSDYSRSGWCPGTATQPTYIYLDELTPGKHTIKVAIPQGKAEGGSFSAWSVSGVLIGDKK